MSREEVILERLILEIEGLKTKLDTVYDFMHKLESIYDLLAGHKIFWLRSSFVCADPHATSNGHLPGAYSEGEQIKDVLVSKHHSVTLKRHPVSKDDFLANLDQYIVHLAGHGGHDGGGQVYFLFDDGNVYPGDISASSSAPTELFYAGVCLGGWNDTMANAFRAKGTKYYVGFTQTIPDWDAKYFDDLVYEKWLIDGKDLSTALDEADDSYPALNCWVLWD